MKILFNKSFVLIFTCTILSTLLRCTNNQNDKSSYLTQKSTTIFNDTAIDYTRIITYDENTLIDTNSKTIEHLRNLGWYVIKINKSTDFFDELKLPSNNKIKQLVMITHSTIGRFGSYFNMSTICDFATQLKPMLAANAIVYLNGCNTGVECYNYKEYCEGISTAQRLSNLLNVTVYGTKGFMQGNFAVGNETCKRCKGTECYGINAKGKDVWSICKPKKDKCRCLLNKKLFYDKSLNEDIQSLNAINFMNENYAS